MRQEQGLQINHQMKEVHPVVKVKDNHQEQEEKRLKVQQDK